MDVPSCCSCTNTPNLPLRCFALPEPSSVLQPRIIQSYESGAAAKPALRGQPLELYAREVSVNHQQGNATSVSGLSLFMRAEGFWVPSYDRQVALNMLSYCTVNSGPHTYIGHRTLGHRRCHQHEILVWILINPSKGCLE